MTVNDFVQQDSWLNKNDSFSDIVISSRIRFARNLKTSPFPLRLPGLAGTEVQRCQLAKEVINALKSIKNLKKLNYFELNNFNKIERTFFVERHLMSKDHAREDKDRIVAVNDDELISVMINEEDHLRMQALAPGLNLKEALRQINALDDALAAKVDYAFSDRWGYLTSCPTNTGTGMRASVMVHLPCLVMSKQSNKIFEAISKLGLTIRGLYGEGTASSGHIFQISNQVTLGLSEEETVDNLERIIKQIINHEELVRKKLWSQNKIELQDKVYRAYGILTSARMISYHETISLLSALWLGYGMKITRALKKSTINELFIITQPAHIQLLTRKPLSPVERDIKRAEVIQHKLCGAGQGI